MKLRPIGQKDEIFLWDMLFEIVYSLEGERRPSKQVFLMKSDIYKYVKGFGLESTDTGFIAETEDGKMTGAAWYRLYEDNNKGFGYISSDIPEVCIAVTEEYRGKGIGNELLSALIDQARAKGFASLSIHVDSRNTRACNMFKGKDFKVVSSKGTDLIMKLMLS